MNALTPVFGVRRIHDISAVEVDRFHSGMIATPRKANLAVAILSKLMNWLECAATIKMREQRQSG